MSNATKSLVRMSELGAKAQVDRERVICAAAQKFVDLGMQEYADELAAAATNPEPFLEKHFYPLTKGPSKPAGS